MLLVAELAAAAIVLALPARDAPMRPGRQAVAPLIVGDHRSVALINLSGSRAAVLLTRVAANIGAAVDAVEAFWGTDWTHHILVVATGSQAQFAAQAGASVGNEGSKGQWSDIAAVAVADRADPGRRLAAGQRIVFAPGASAMSDAALRIVLCHELFHYATRADTALDAPRWLTEGVADFVARPDSAPAGRPAPPVTLPSDADLDTAGSRRAQAYDRAWWFARFVADSYGAAKLRELYVVACGTGHTGVGEAVRRVLGAGLPDVLTGWQRWLAG